MSSSDSWPWKLQKFPGPSAGSQRWLEGETPLPHRYEDSSEEDMHDHSWPSTGPEKAHYSPNSTSVFHQQRSCDGWTITASLKDPRSVCLLRYLKAVSSSLCQVTRDLIPAPLSQVRLSSCPWRPWSLVLNWPPYGIISRIGNFHNVQDAFCK